MKIDKGFSGIVVIVCIVATMFLMAGTSVSAATVDVSIVDFAFNPQFDTITVGTTVRWTNEGAVTHTSTSNTGVWNTGDIAPGGSSSFTFNTVGTFPYHCAIHTFMTATIVVRAATDVGEETTELPGKFYLAPNYPNPFNPATTIEYNLPFRAHVALTVYNMANQVVSTLVNTEQAAGTYSLQWDGTTASGGPVATGVYFYRLQAGAFTQIRKMVLVK